MKPGAHTSHTCSVRRSERRGSAIVELTLTLPFLLLIVLGVAFFGRVFYASMVVNNAARAGTAYGMRAEGDTLAAKMIAAAAADGSPLLTDSNVTVSTYYCRCAPPEDPVPVCGAPPDAIPAPKAGCLDAAGKLLSCSDDSPKRRYVHVETTYTFNTFGVGADSTTPIEVCLPGSLCIPSSVTLRGCSIMRQQ